MSAGLAHVTVGVAFTGISAENSEVLLPGSVAVELRTCPARFPSGTVTENDALPEASVVTEVAPRYVLPSPYPEALAVGLAKNSRWKVSLGVLFTDPVMTVPVVVETAELSTG